MTDLECICRPPLILKITIQYSGGLTGASLEPHCSQIGRKIVIFDINREFDEINSILLETHLNHKS